MIQLMSYSQATKCVFKVFAVIQVALIVIIYLFWDKITWAYYHGSMPVLYHHSTGPNVSLTIGITTVDQNKGNRTLISNLTTITKISSRQNLVLVKDDMNDAPYRNHKDRFIPLSEMSIEKFVPSTYDEYWLREPEILVENMNIAKRNLTQFELAGNNIMMVIRTGLIYHKTRLPSIYDTWLTTVNRSNVFIETDKLDKEYQEKNKILGIHYIKFPCGIGHDRRSLCCRTSGELQLMFKPENKHYDWFCHFDDDIYVNMKNLIDILATFDPKTEQVYFGRPANAWEKPHRISETQKVFKVVKKRYRFHFALGATYCLSRPMIDTIKTWLGNKTFPESCLKWYLNDDNMLGAIIGLLAHKRLSRTQLFKDHTIILSRSVYKIKEQITFSYGCGTWCYMQGYSKNNAVIVPNPKFTVRDDPTRFKSIHCYIHPDAPLCQ